MDFGSCIKYGVLFWFSTIFAVLGIIIVAIGAVTQITYHFDDSNIIQFNFLSTPAILIFIGIVIFVMAFLGCCGALKENHCMIQTFSYLLLLLFILEIAAVIACYVNRGQIKTILENRLNETMSQYGNNTDVQKSWDLMQHEFVCCGVEGAEDWNKIGERIPASCCEEIPYDPVSQQAQDCEVLNANKIGCFNVILNTLEKTALILGLSAAGIALIQVVMICFSCALARSIRRDYTTV